MRLFVPIRTVEGTPWDMALVDITEEELETIFEIAKIVEEHDCTSVNRVDMIDVFPWSQLHADDIPEGAVRVLGSPASHVIQVVTEDDLARISSCEIVIAKDSIWWEFYVKHIEDRFETLPVAFELLTTAMQSEGAPADV